MTIPVIVILSYHNIMRIVTDTLNNDACKISTDKFMYTSKSKSFFQELSMLKHSGFISTPIFIGLHNVGFWLVSHKTGKEIPFVFLQYQDDAVAVFCPVEGYLSDNDSNNNLKVLISND